MYIIDRIEHGNGGVCGTEILAKMRLKDALKTTPSHFGVDRKEWGFWPVICRGKNANKPSYYWDELEWTWKKSSAK